MSKQKEEAKKLISDLPLTRKQGDIIIGLLSELLKKLNSEESIQEVMKSSGVRPIKLIKPEEKVVTKEKQKISRYCNISDFIIFKNDNIIDTFSSNCIAIVLETIINKYETLDINPYENFITISIEDKIKSLKGNFYDIQSISKALIILQKKNYISYRICANNIYKVIWTAESKNPLERSINNGNLTNNLKNLNYVDISTIIKIPIVYRELVGRLLDTTRTKSSSIPQFYTTEHGEYDKDSILEAISKSPIDDMIKLMFETYWLKQETNSVFIYNKNTDKYSLNTNMLYNAKNLKEI